METNKQRTRLLLSVIAACVLFFVTFLVFPYRYYHNLLRICSDGAAAAAVILAALSVLFSEHRKPFLIAGAAALCFVAFSAFFIYYSGAYAMAVTLISAAAVVLAVLQVIRRQRVQWSEAAFAACLCAAAGLSMWQSERWGELFPVLLLGIVWILGILRHRCPHVGAFTLLAAAAGSALSLYEISRSSFFHGEMRGSYVWFNFLQIILEGAWPVLLAFAVQPKTDEIRRKKTAFQHVLCPQCGGINESGTKFCIFCGAPLPAVKAVRFCQACGAECRSQAKYCPACGKALSAAEQPVQSNPPDSDANKQIIQ